MPGVTFKFRQHVIRDARRWARESTRALEDIQAMIPAALEEAMKPVFDTSQELVPVDVGFLKVSAFMETETTPKAFVVKGQIGYGPVGSFANQYALLQHENLEFRHKPPAQAKFLEEAFNREGSAIPERFANAMKRMIG